MQLPGAVPEALGDQPLGLAEQLVDAHRDVLAGLLDQAVGEQQQRVAAVQPAALARRTSRPGRRRAAGPRWPRSSASGRSRRRTARPAGARRTDTTYSPDSRSIIDVGDGREALLPLLAQQVAVGRGQELLVRHRAEQAAERAGQQQRAGAGVDALAGDVDQRDLELAAVVGAGRRRGSRRRTTRRRRSGARPRLTSRSGRPGISPWAVSRSRRSTSIESPRVPCTPSRPRRPGQRVHDRRRSPRRRGPRPGDTCGSVARTISPARSPPRPRGRAAAGCAR